MLHKHHILPKRLGGGDTTVLLTIPQHAEAHRLLWEKYGQWQDYLAWKALSGLIGRDEMLLAIARETGKKNRGQKRTTQTRANLSAARRRSGHNSIPSTLPIEWRAAISNARREYSAERACSECGKLFQAHVGKAKFCSDACKQRDHRRKQPKSKSKCECVECGKSFLTFYKNKAKYCSHTCNARNWERKQRA